MTIASIPSCGMLELTYEHASGLAQTAPTLAVSCGDLDRAHDRVAPQLYWSGHASWRTAIGLEAVHWLSWSIVAPLVFCLCRRLYGGEHTWKRYAVGLVLGAIVISTLQPLLIETISFGKDLVQWRLAVADSPPRLSPRCRRGE